jgi:HD-GYP domain-containing protein (c-di-GMP phosphodiesterase class II)
MAILDRDSGSHFDPAVMDAFRPIARDVFERLADCDEGQARQLLDERVRLHFGI